VPTSAPTGAGKGVGAVIPNLIDYPGSAFILDLKGENYAVTARARRAAGQDVFLVDPFGVAGSASHALNWLDTSIPTIPKRRHPDRSHRLRERTALEPQPAARLRRPALAPRPGPLAT
jgi:hypothetical protein